MTLLLNKAKELCRAYGVADTNANNFTVFGLTVMAEMKNNKARFDAMVVVNNNGDADKAARLCGLMTYLKDNGFFTDKNDAYTVLSGLNSRLVRQWVAPPCVCSRCKLQYWRALLEAMKVNGNHTALVVELLALDPNILCRFYPLFATISNQSHMKDVLLTFYRLRHECHVSAQRFTKPGNCIPSEQHLVVLLPGEMEITLARKPISCGIFTNTCAAYLRPS
jgi:hypothetical protein